MTASDYKVGAGFELMCESLVRWWDDLPPSLRQDVEGSGAEPGCVGFARAALKSRLWDFEIRYAADKKEHDDLLANWRGRRLLACRAASELHDVAAALAADDGTEGPPGGVALSGEAPRPEWRPPSPGQVRELQNLSALWLRMVLQWNDGRVSPDTLNRF